MIKVISLILVLLESAKKFHLLFELCRYHVYFCCVTRPPMLTNTDVEMCHTFRLFWMY